MNKVSRYLFVPSLLAALMGCKDDLPNDMVTINFGVHVANLENASPTRAADDSCFGDGKAISQLKCYVYNTANGGNAAPVKVIDVDIKDVNGNKGGDVSVSLPKGETFDFVFLATAIPQTDPTSKLYYNTATSDLKVNYSLVNCNDEQLDCFFASKASISTEAPISETVLLKRPFAQLNIGTQDYDSYYSSNPVANISVAVDAAYDTVSLMDGTLKGTAAPVSFAAAAVPDGFEFPTADHRYLTVNYVLTGSRRLVGVALTVNHSDAGTAPKTIEFSDIAIERNYQTNIYGSSILTETAE